MAVTASFDPGTGVLTVFGDALDNTITISRNAAGTILVNGGAMPVSGGTPTVANTSLIQVFGQNGNDTVTLDESNGALPRANLFGGAGNDVLTGGSGNDQLFGQGGLDTLLGKGGFDSLFGGTEDDVLTGGDADDQVFGESGNDRMIWNPGDDTDLNEGDDGTDATEVNGGNGAEVFTATANGTRVRFDRLDPAPFALDIGTTESLVVNMNGGNDTFSAIGNLAALIAITVDGGAGDDTILGGNGADLLLGGDGNDFIDGQQGNDVAFLGAGDDVFQWDPGDGSDVVEGQGGADTLLFNGSGANENIALSANGARVLLTRDVGSIVMDINDLETVTLNALGGTDTVRVNDLSGTDVDQVNVNLAGTLGGSAGDGAADTVIINGTNGANAINVVGAGTSVSVTGLPAQVAITNAEGANDTLVVNALGGTDTVTATTLPAGVIRLTIDGGAGDDTIRGSQGADVFLGGDGNDVVLGDNGNDVAFLGAGDDEFQWDPGDGNDTVEGQDGIDTLLFTGSGASENINVSANGGRVLFFRDVANITMDLDDVETIRFRALGGADNIVVGDLSGTDATRIDVDLKGPNGGGDGQVDTVTVNGTQGDDVFGVANDAGGIHVFGLQAAVDILFAGTNDRLVLNALGGDDVIDASSLDADVVQLTMNGGLGEDIFIGSDGDDLVNGGDGNDTALMGAGDDTFVWNPGDDNDTLEGQSGADTLLFNGANVSEIITIQANGGRVLFFRDIASVLQDLNDVETIDFRALGGVDTINVNDLSGTDVTKVSIDLAATLGGSVGDAQADRVIVQGTAGANAVTVAAVGGIARVIGLPAVVDVVHADAPDSLLVNVLGGMDIVTVDNLAGTGLTQVDVDLGGADGQTDRAIVLATAGADAVTVTALGGVVTVNGLAAIVDVSGIESALDGLTVNGLGGNDTINAETLVPGLIHLTIDAGAGNDVVTGSQGADNVLGGSGDDRVVDSDFVNFDAHNGGAGIDTIDYSTVGFASGIVTINLATGQTSVNGGNTEAVVDFENVRGSQGGETIVGNAANNLLEGNDGDDALQGGAGNDTLEGGNGNDSLDGGTGADKLRGSVGDDTYTVDAASDVVTELAGQGADTVVSFISLTLGSNLENLTLAGGANLNGTGNGLANTLVGNGGANTLDGKGGADTMSGGAGSDDYRVDNAGDVVNEAPGGGTDRVLTSVSYALAPGQAIEVLMTANAAASTALTLTGNELANTLIGNAGNNVLNGLGGADAMRGGDGNDTYVVDANGDVVTELAGGGTDTVQAGISETLAANVENLTLTGLADIDGTGNALANTLLGNAGNNLLDGQAGADVMRGGAGDDGYAVDNAGDAITELAGQGTDSVRASISHTLANQVENLTLTGGANIDGTGNTLANQIVGNGGSNVLAGKAGNDLLTGNAGQDSFLFDTALNGMTNVDTVADYNVAADTMRLDIDIFTAFAGTGVLAAAAFRVGGAALDADDRIIFDAATNNLFYDRDGTGAAAQVQFAHLNGTPALTNADFLIVA